jgi:hypothetical protein
MRVFDRPLDDVRLRKLPFGQAAHGRSPR